MSTWMKNLYPAVIAELPELDACYHICVDNTGTEVEPIYRLTRWDDTKLGPWDDAVWQTKVEAYLDKEFRRQVNAERDRRNGDNIVFNGHAFQADEISRLRLQRAAARADRAIAAGKLAGDLRWHDKPIDFFWITVGNAHVPMDAQTVVAFDDAMTDREGLLIAAADTIKSMDPRPVDVTDAALWPSG